MNLHPLAGKPAPASMLVNVPRLITAYFAERPDAAIASQRVAFGTSGHRGSAFERAFKSAGITPDDVDYINAHGTSTPIGDPAESLAIEQAFGAHATKMGVSSTKSMHGHALGGAGGLEGVATVMSVATDIMPPTINYEFPDPECTLDYVPNVARKAPINVAFSNSFGFGGHNSVIVFGKVR